MKLLYLYKWIAGSMTDFVNQFKGNATLYQQARDWWGQLEQWSVFIILVMLFGVLLAVWYYKPYNEQPGRHYKPKHWFFFLGITFILTFLATILLEYIAVEPYSKDAWSVAIRIALGNAIYATLLYFITSFVWCNWLPTNAYRLFKI